jgi:hypothetical protein
MNKGLGGVADAVSTLTEDVPLTQEQMKKLLPGVPVFMYEAGAPWTTSPDKFKSELTAGRGGGMLFWPENTTSDNGVYGHWLGVCTGDTTDSLFVFDPFGFSHHKPANECDPYYTYEVGPGAHGMGGAADASDPSAIAVPQPYLSQVAAALHLTLVPSYHAFQSDRKKGLATCGRHVVLRLRHSHLDNDQYTTLFLRLQKRLHVDTPDELVCLLVPDP